MRVEAALQDLDRYSHAVMTAVGADGYPVAVATEFTVDGGAIELVPPSTGDVPLTTADVHLVFSHIRPQPGTGYDERTYVELGGVLETSGRHWRFTPATARGWAEADVPFMELCERALPQARRYLASLGEARGHEVKPVMGTGTKFFLATRLPFLTATLVPVLLGVAAAGLDHQFNLGLAALTLVGAVSVHLGLNVINDVFDASSGADDFNVNPTMFSGGSRVIQYGLVSRRQMATLAAACYAIAIAVGLYLTLVAGPGLLWLGAAGVLISYFYTAPPLRLVHRGLGELCVALGFGPIMVLGAYYVQTGHYGLRPLVLSVPVAILVMLILYANEIPDRVADARAGKRTLVVRLRREVVLNGYAGAAAMAYAAVILGVVSRVLPWETLLALVTAPLAVRTYRGLRDNYEDPYVLMGSLQNNVVLHLSTGSLMIAGTLLGLIGT